MQSGALNIAITRLLLDCYAWDDVVFAIGFHDCAGRVDDGQDKQSDRVVALMKSGLQDDLHGRSGLEFWHSSRLDQLGEVGVVEAITGEEEAQARKACLNRSDVLHLVLPLDYGL